MLKTLCISPSCKCKVCPAIGHVHGIGMVILHQEFEFFYYFLGRTSLHRILSPVTEPPCINLPSENHSLWLNRPGKHILYLAIQVINANVRTIPMTFSYVKDPIHVVLLQIDPQPIPHIP